MARTHTQKPLSVWAVSVSVRQEAFSAWDVALEARASVPHAPVVCIQLQHRRRAVSAVQMERMALLLGLRDVYSAQAAWAMPSPHAKGLVQACVLPALLALMQGPTSLPSAPYALWAAISKPAGAARDIICQCLTSPRAWPVKQAPTPLDQANWMP